METFVQKALEAMKKGPLNMSCLHEMNIPYDVMFALVQDGSASYDQKTTSFRLTEKGKKLAETADMPTETAQAVPPEHPVPGPTANPMVEYIQRFLTGVASINGTLDLILESGREIHVQINTDEVKSGGK